MSDVIKYVEAEQALSSFYIRNEEDMRSRAFGNAQPNKVQLNFPNGNWLSSVWGWGCYSDWGSSRMMSGGDKPQISEFAASNLVEVMFTCGDRLHKRLHKKFDGDGGVIGYLQFDEWLYIVNALANEKRETSNVKEKEVAVSAKTAVENKKAN